MNHLESPAAPPLPDGNANTIDRLLTLKQVAVYLQLHEKTVLRLTNRGRLPCVRIGRSIRFVPRDVQRFVSARRDS